MPGCCVDGCYESEKKGVRLFKLPQGPKNIERRAQWIHNINRKDIPSGGYVCEVSIYFFQLAFPLHFYRLETLYTRSIRK